MHVAPPYRSTSEIVFSGAVYTTITWLSIPPVATEFT